MCWLPAWPLRGQLKFHRNSGDRAFYCCFFTDQDTEAQSGYVEDRPAHAWAAEVREQSLEPQRVVGEPCSPVTRTPQGPPSCPGMRVVLEPGSESGTGNWMVLRIRPGRGVCVWLCPAVAPCTASYSPGPSGLDGGWAGSSPSSRGLWEPQRV